MKFIGLIFAALVSFSTFAAGTHECGSLDSIGNLMGNTKSFGTSIKTAYVSTEEPAAAPDHLLVFVYDNEMGYSCTAVSMDDQGSGFGSVNMKTIKQAAYSSKKGVLLTVDVSIPDFTGMGKSTVQTLKIRVNQATGKVTLE